MTDTPMVSAESARGHKAGEGFPMSFFNMLELAKTLERENIKLRAFAAATLKDWPDYMGLDGFDLQGLAAEHGLLAAKDPKPTEPCSQDEGRCRCAEYYSAADLKDGVICYQRTPLLVGHNVDVSDAGTAFAGQSGCATKETTK